MIENIKVDENKKAKFKVDSRLITQILGSEIIESHSIAFAEQIKNAQDAGASEVTIDFSNIKNDEIIITDNGNGMSELEVEEDWFLLGNSKKDGEASTSGGKGIGRLSLFKIGDSFQVKTSNGHEVTTFSISNKELMKEKTESFETDLYTEIRNESIGTQIKIKELDNEIILKEIELELNNLLSDDNKLDLKIIYPVDFTPTPFFTKGDIEGVVPFSASIFI
ncbi:TPA: ATP-binding protein, partial [Listeria monocytogenes]